MIGAAREDCRGDLLAQGRRGALSDAGKLALDAHLAACATCRTARDVWSDFDAVDVVDVRDGARVRALADAVRARSGARRRARAARPWAAAAAVLLIVGGSASAAVWLWQRPAADGRARSPVAATAARDAHVRGARAPEAPQPAAVETPAPAAARQPTARRASTIAAAERPRVSAAELLSAASDARGQGDTERATTLYRKLQREYPGTAEAVVSTLPLGRLLLAAGSGRAALAQFDTYLRASARGPLVAEALYGKGQACALLDDVGEERATWWRLLADHAGSPYAPHARRRLASLQP